MAQFGSLRVVERTEGESMAAQFRRDGYPGYNSSQNARGYLRLAEIGVDEPLISLAGPNAHAIANSKGFLVLDLLRRLVGESQFRARMRAFVARRSFTAIAWDDFLAAIGQGNTDVTQFTKDWITGTGAPYIVARLVDGQLIVRDSGAAFLAPVELVIIGHSQTSVDTIRTTVTMRDGVAALPLPLALQIDTVIIDPRYRVLRWTSELKHEAHALRSFTRGVSLETSGKTAGAAIEYNAGLDSLEQPDVAGAEFYLRYALAGLAMNAQKWTEARTQLEAALQLPVRPRARLANAYLRLAQVAQSQHDTAEAHRAAQSAVAADAAIGGTWISVTARRILGRLAPLSP